MGGHPVKWPPTPTAAERCILRALLAKRDAVAAVGWLMSPHPDLKLRRPAELAGEGDAQAEAVLAAIARL